MQLYIERCRMHLEPEVTIKGSEGDVLNAADVEWSWMNHYRVWEANREVFLFPENYYDPTLRKDKSTPYADLQNKLSQGNLTKDTAQDFFQLYFSELEALTNLNAVSTCLAVTTNFINGSLITQNTFFVFAKLNNSNGGYYYRTANAVKISDAADLWNNWTNWEKLTTGIKAESISSLYANNRPFIFWVEYLKQQVTAAGTNKSQYGTSKTFNYTCKIYYAFQKANGQWTSPHEVPDPGNVLNFVATPGITATDVLEVNISSAPFITQVSDVNASTPFDANCLFLDIAEATILVKCYWWYSQYCFNYCAY